MKLMLIVLEPLLLTDAVLWALIGHSYFIATVWVIVAIAMPKLANWVGNG